MKRIGITPHTTFHFKRAPEPVRPRISRSRSGTFAETVNHLDRAHIPLNRDIETEATNQQFFKDGDGNLLEVYAHDYVRKDVLGRGNPLGVMYRREVGFVVDNTGGFHDWLGELFGTVLTKGHRDSDFCITAVGTAHFVLNHATKRWIPINSTALKPQMRFTLGTPDVDDVERFGDRTDTIAGPDVLPAARRLPTPDPIDTRADDGNGTEAEPPARAVMLRFVPPRRNGSPRSRSLRNRP